MKTAVSTSSSGRSSTTMEDRSENRDSCYFPGCRKDANCHCEICLASINATLDLMPMSIQQSSLTKLSASKSMVERTPISFNRSLLLTPRKGTHQIFTSPPLKSTAKSRLWGKMEKKRKKPWDIGFDFWRFFVGISLIFAADSIFSCAVSELFQPTLSPEMIRRVGKESLVVQDLNGRLGFLQNNLGEIVNGKVSNCSSIDSIWKLSQDGLLLNSRCTLYKSSAEEVSIWGWPLQTAGLLATGFSSRSLTIISGRITEWSEGKIRFSIREANTSWVHERLRASAVQLDANTWVLEYQRSPILENSRLFLAALELLKLRISKIVGEMKQQFLLLPAFAHQFSNPTQDNFRCPT